jgi:hypothetical protein
MAKVLEFVQRRTDAGSSPTLKEIAAHCAWSSTATAAGVLRSLRARRLLRRDGHRLTLIAPKPEP